MVRALPPEVKRCVLLTDDETARFDSVTTFPYHLLYRLKRFIPKSGLPLARRIDHSLLTLFPNLQTFAGGVVIRVGKK